MATIAVVGPGAVGGTVAAELSRGNAHDVTACVRTAFDRLEITTPSGLLVATPRLLLDPAAAASAASKRAFHWVLVATKTYDHAATAEWLRALCSAGTRVAILQNGIEHVERFARYLPAELLVPVVVYVPAERSAPGRVRVRRAASLIAPATDGGRDFAALFAHTEVRASAVADFRTELWRKLCLNCAGAVSAVLVQPAAIASRGAVAELMFEVAAECRAVGLAEGAVLGEDVLENAVAGYRAGSDAINSLHADRLAGRPMEVDARNGVVVRFGKKHGVSTPLNQAMVTLLEAAQPHY